MKEFKLIVAGGRDFNDEGKAVEEIVLLAEGSLKNYNVSIVSGMARGADALGTRFAKNHNVKLYEFPANWEAYGKRAGFLRNAQMAEFADGLLAFWDGKSKGTAHMIKTMEAQGKPVRVVNY